VTDSDVATRDTRRKSAPPEAAISDGHTGISKIEPNRIVTRRYLLCMQAFQGGNP